jgi:hypothetical protein
MNNTADAARKLEKKAFEKHTGYIAIPLHHFNKYSAYSKANKMKR